MSYTQLVQAANPLFSRRLRREDLIQLRPVERCRRDEWNLKPQATRFADQKNLVARCVEFLICKFEGLPGRNIRSPEKRPGIGVRECLPHRNDALQRSEPHNQRPSCEKDTYIG